MNYEPQYDDELDAEDEDYDIEDSLDELEVDEREKIPRPTLDETLAALREGEATSAAATVYYGLSDLDDMSLLAVREVWETLSPEYRLKVCQQALDIGEMNFELDYTALARMALDDSDSAVRAAAVELFWTDETAAGLHRMIDLATEDDAAAVRAAASSALGRYILLGEFDELPEAETNSAVDVALSIYNNVDEEVEVRRRALESLGYSSQDGVNDIIREAYASDEHLLKVSAVFAMGKSFDDRWSSAVLRELNSPDAEMRYEAARASGELALDDALPKLSRMVYDPDREVKEVAIWSLGEIGGSESTRILQTLLDDPQYIADDDDLAEAIEDALVSASMPGGDLGLFDLGLSDEGDWSISDDDWDDDEEADDPSRWN
jgi:hypothetical protein